MVKRTTHDKYIGIILLIFFSLIYSKSTSQCTSTINTFPYNEGFEADNGNWTIGGSASDWAWGAPHKQLINAAASGNNCWITGTLNAGVAYNNNERAWIQSPCFDFSTLKNPFIQFDVFWETEPQYDGASLQSSIDNGKSWQTVGAYGDKSCGNANWFNYQSINFITGGTSSAGWSGSTQSPGGGCNFGGGSGKWLTAKHTLSNLAGQPGVMFRFMFGAGSKCNDYDGFAIDNILINDQAPVITLTTQIKNVNCNGGSDGSITVNASGGAMPYTYAWSPDVSNSFKAINIPANNYIINVSDNNNCQQSTSVTVTQPAPTTIAVVTANTTCKLNDGSATANVSGGVTPYNYTWGMIQQPDTVTVGNTGNINHINTLNMGNYVAEIKDANNCLAVSAPFIIKEQPPLKISLGADTVICPGTNFTISPGSFETYLWQDNSTTSIFRVTSPGTYSVAVTDMNNCNASASILVSPGDCSGIYFPSAFSPNGDGVNDKFGISGTVGPVTNYHLRIYNRWGQLVFESYSPSEKWDGKLKDFAVGNETFVWESTFTVNNQKKILKGTVVVIQ